MSEEFVIRDATAADLPAVIPIHLAAFRGFFLSLMGPRFLHALYSGFLNHPSGLFKVACVPNAPAQVLGFVAGTTQPDGFFKALLKKRWYAFLWAAVWPLLRHPSLVIQKLWSALFYRGETLPDMPRAALLSSLGVSPGFQGKGLGLALVDSFVQECRRKQIPAVYLTTDQSDNDKANAFYLRCGFKLAGTCKRPPNRILNRYLTEISLN